MAPDRTSGGRDNLQPASMSSRITSSPRPSRASGGLAMVLSVLDSVARALASAGVSANAVTGCALLGGAVGGLCLAGGHFGAAAIVIALASLGDALDGRIARATRTASPAGALFDAAVDRYEELFVLGGLAYFFRASAGMLVTVLFAIAGSFMVSYGSAKAEALGVPVPGGIMRRTERAVLVCGGIALVPVAGFFARRFSLPAWVETAPIAIALLLVAIGGNISAVARLRVIAREAGRRSDLRP